MIQNYVSWQIDHFRLSWCSYCQKYSSEEKHNRVVSSLREQNFYYLLTNPCKNNQKYIKLNAIISINITCSSWSFFHGLLDFGWYLIIFFSNPQYFYVYVLVWKTFIRNWQSFWNGKIFYFCFFMVLQFKTIFKDVFCPYRFSVNHFIFRAMNE